MSPRRSSRARTTQLTPSLPQQTTSSTSSISSGQADRSTRSHHKIPSPQNSLPRSQSREDPDETTKPQPRRTRSGHEDVKDNSNHVVEDEEDEDGEEEITRCICGNTDYPGLPLSLLEALRQAAREGGDNRPSLEILPEDAGGLFIQCDMCKVWQHGGCVGIFDEASTPDEYFCEQCRKDFHRITSTSDGQKYSRYLPGPEEPSPQTSPTPSVQDSPKKTKESRSSRPSAEALAHKRRSTMNSRDAAYDENEQFQRAIEASKKEGGAPSTDNGSRRNKRSRSESEEHNNGIKRQRTGSGSSSSSLAKLRPNGNSEEDAPSTKKPHDSGAKKLRGAAARNHREREIHVRKREKETKRADDAGRRKARSERRRPDDSDPSEESVSADTSAKDVPENSTTADVSLPPLDKPAINETPPVTKVSHKKTGRGQARRGRVGRNQYTKDREVQAIASHGHSRNASLLEALDNDTPSGKRRSRSRSVMNDSRDYTMGANGHPHNYINGISSTSGGGGGNGTWGESGKPSKPKHMNPNRTSLNEMKRRVAGILEFISRTQAELALAGSSPKLQSGSQTPSPQQGSPPKSRPRPPQGLALEGLGNQLDGGGGIGGKEKGRYPCIIGMGITFPNASDNGGSPTVGDLLTVKDEDFKSLSSTEMMRVLAGHLEGWQKEFGRWGEK